MISIKNELHRSQNPYLLQHKDNPVAWHLWGNQAFEEAKQRDVPLLVSIGYSTCHWCHVMAHEVFEDEEAAAIMNDHLVCIKVDREEHPEVDEVYMEACQAMNGSGGWPLNVFIGHDGKPFFAVTYVARENWKDLVLRVSNAWKENRSQIADFTIQLTAALQAETNTNAQDDFDLKEQLFTFLEEHYDKEHPDFSSAGRAPRFPSHTLYAFLLSSQKIPEAVSTKLESVLEAIQDSGLHDRVGGGFHRYSTDREWRVPHFEKMLYDNAQLIVAFSVASSRYRRPDFMQTAENIAAYLIRDLAIYEGDKLIGFASAEDADDPGGEGNFYAWSPEQLKETLGEELGTAVASEWNITNSNANVHGVFTYRIPHPRGSKVFQSLSFKEKMNHRLEWASVYDKLLTKRQFRPRPFRDEKIVTETNALALIGFSVLYAHTLKPSYLKIINDLAEILKERFDGVVLQRLPGKKGHITDYGHSGLALFTAWEATFNENYLNMAVAIVKSAFNRFATQEGAIYTSDNESDMFMRFEEKYDHAQPAGAHSLSLAWERIYSIGRMKNYEPLVRSIIARRQKGFSQIPYMVSSFIQTIHELVNGPVTLKVPPSFMNDSPELLKYVGTDVRLIPDFQNNVYQLCNKDRCLIPVKTSKELDLKFAW